MIDMALVHVSLRNRLWNEETDPEKRRSSINIPASTCILSYSLKHSVKKYFEWRTVNVFRALSFDRSVPKTIQLWCTVRVIKTAFTVSPRFFSFFFFFFLITLKLDFSGKGSSNAILAQTLGIKVILTSTVQFRGYIKLRLYRFLHILSLLFVFASRNNV